MSNHYDVHLSLIHYHIPTIIKRFLKFLFKKTNSKSCKLIPYNNTKKNDNSMEHKFLLKTSNHGQ